MTDTWALISHVRSWGVWSCLCICMSHFEILREQTGIFPVTQNSKKCNGQISEGMILGNLFVQQSHLQGFLNNINFWVCTGIQAQKQTYSVLNVALVFLLLSTSLNIHIYTQLLG